MVKKLVIYTAPFGDKVVLMPQPRINNVDFICLTDTPRKVKGWQMKKVPRIYADDNTRNNRYYKILPHLVFPEYDRSIYIDSNYLVQQIPRDFFESAMKGAHMATFDHKKNKADPRDCIYDEYEAIKQMEGKRYIDDPVVMEKQIAFLQEQHYPRHNGLIFGGILIRDHNDPLVIKTMDAWWQMVSTRSRRDQLSFNYVAWKTGLQVAYLDGESKRGNPWFYFTAKTNEPLVYSFLKYKLRKLLPW